jgi:hypothetical protein
MTSRNPKLTARAPFEARADVSYFVFFFIFFFFIAMAVFLDEW